MIFPWQHQSSNEYFNIALPLTINIKGGATKLLVRMIPSWLYFSICRPGCQSVCKHTVHTYARMHTQHTHTHACMGSHTHTHTHTYTPPPIHFVLFKVKDLVAKQHPTNTHTHTHTQLNLPQFTLQQYPILDKPFSFGNNKLCSVAKIGNFCSMFYAIFSKVCELKEIEVDGNTYEIIYFLGVIGNFLLWQLELTLQVANIRVFGANAQ